MLQRTLARKWKDKPEWEKIFANHPSNKGLTFKICKELQLSKRRDKP